jgi:hypothetical protein
MSVFGTAALAQNASATSISTLNASPALATAAGDLLVVAVRWSSTLAVTASVSDTAGNTYVPLPSQSAGNSAGTAQLFYVIGAKANTSNTIEASFSGAVTFSFIFVWDYPVSGGTAAYDTQVGAESLAGSLSSLNSGNFTTTGIDELVLVGIAPNQVALTCSVSTSGYTLDSANVGSGGYGGAAHATFSSPQSGISVTGAWSVVAPSAQIVVAAFNGTASAPSSSSTSGPAYVAGQSYLGLGLATTGVINE